MTKYNYMEAVKEDVKNYIDSEINFEDFDSLEELEEKLNDELWTEDSVTGNASGSYTFNRVTAENYVNSNKELVNEMVDEFDCKKQVCDWYLNDNFESIDVSIRCYLLGSAISEVLDELEEDFDEARKEMEV
mgnify:CR=1 FL=1|jgi:hypothetical protein